MFFGVHLDVVLGEASLTVVLEEATVATIQNVSFGIVEAWVGFRIDGTVHASDVLGHKRGSMCGVLAMEDEKRFARLFVFEELCGKLLLVIEVYGAIYMTTFILVLEATVNDNSLLIYAVKFTVQNVNHGLLRNAWQIASLVARVEMWQVWLMWGFNISD